MKVTDFGTKISDLTAICGESLPSGAQLTAYDRIYDTQTKQSLEEAIVEWDSPNDAASLIKQDHFVLDQTGGCSFNTDGQTAHWIGNYPGSLSSNCSNSQYAATQVSIKQYGSGFEASGQCGRYTVTTVIYDDNGSTATQKMDNAYLNKAITRLQAAIEFAQS